MNRISLLLLEGCKRCETLKSALEKNNTNFESTVCKSDTALCDNIEDIINCSNYPIVLKLDLNNNIKEIGFITDNYSEIGKEIKFPGNIKGFAYYSVDKLIDYVLNS